MEQIPIAQLSPELLGLESKQIRAIVTLVWPFSSRTRKCALLLAEPDFRLRTRRGQVRVRFNSSSARAIAGSGIGIGDEVVLGLRGAQFVDEDTTVTTPGKSIDWDLSYSQTLVAQIFRNGQEVANLSLENVAPTPSGSPIRQHSHETPRRGTPSAPASIQQWMSPAFLKRARLSSDSIFAPGYDYLFRDTDEEPNKKRRRKSYRDWPVWKYSDRTPSPEKEGSEGEKDASMAGTPIRHGRLPVTPISPHRHGHILHAKEEDVAGEQGQDLQAISHVDDATVEYEATARDVTPTFEALREAEDHDMYAGSDEMVTNDMRYAYGGDTEPNTEVEESPEARPTTAKTDTEASVIVPSPFQHVSEVASPREGGTGPAGPGGDELRHVHNQEAAVVPQGRISLKHAPQIVMPPPILPSLQTNLQPVLATTLLTPIGQQPRSPIIKPLDSATLPMPSPFPGERDDANSLSYFENISTNQPPDQPQMEAKSTSDREKLPRSEADPIVEDSFDMSIDHDTFGWAQANHESAYTDVRFTFGMDGSTVALESDPPKSSKPAEEAAQPGADVAVEPTDGRSELYGQVAEELVEEVAEEVADEVMEHLRGTIPEAPHAVRAELVEVLAEEFEEEFPSEFRKEITEEVRKQLSQTESSRLQKSSELFEQFTDDTEKKESEEGTDNMPKEKTAAAQAPSAAQEPSRLEVVELSSDVESHSSETDSEAELDNARIIQREEKRSPTPADEMDVDETEVAEEESPTHGDTTEELPIAGQPGSPSPNTNARSESLTELPDPRSPPSSATKHEEKKDVDDGADYETLASESLFREASRLERSIKPIHGTHQTDTHTKSNQEDEPLTKFRDRANDLSNLDATRPMVSNDVDEMDGNMPDVGARRGISEKQESPCRHADVEVERLEGTSSSMEPIPIQDDDEIMIAVPEADDRLGTPQLKSVSPTGPARNTRSKTGPTMTPSKKDYPTAQDGRSSNKLKSSVASATPSPSTFAQTRRRSTASPARSSLSPSPYATRSQSKALSPNEAPAVASGSETLRDGKPLSPLPRNQTFSEHQTPLHEDDESQQFLYQPSQELGTWQYQPSQELGLWQRHTQGKFANVTFIRDSEEGSSHSEHSLSTIPFSDDYDSIGAHAYIDYSDAVEPMHSSKGSPGAPSSVPPTPQRRIAKRKSLSQTPSKVQTAAYDLSSEPAEKPEEEGSGEVTPKAVEGKVPYSKLPVARREREDMLASASPPHREASLIPHEQDSASFSLNQQSVQTNIRPLTPEPTQRTFTQSQTLQSQTEQNLPLTPQLSQAASAGLAAHSALIEVPVKMEVEKEETPQKSPILPSEQAISSPKASMRTARTLRTPSVHSEDLSASDTEAESQTFSKLPPPSTGLSTPTSYYTPLKDLPFFLNRSSSFHTGTQPDILALVTSSTTPATRATSGPKHYNTTLQITDLSTFPSTTTVNVFRAYSSALPVADAGDVILLRSFIVKSMKRKCMLVSGDESAWAVYRWGKPVWGFKKNLVCAEVRAREEVRGPVVERGEGEWKEVERLRGWWVREVKEKLEQVKENEGGKNGKGKGKEKAEGEGRKQYDLRHGRKGNEKEQVQEVPTTPSRKGSRGKGKAPVATPLRVSPRKKKSDSQAGESKL